MEAKVRIRRWRGKGSTNGVEHDPMEPVYVTGPHFTENREAVIFGRARPGIFSSTTDPDDPEAQFTRAEAERLIALGKWANLHPSIVGNES